MDAIPFTRPHDRDPPLPPDQPKVRMDSSSSSSSSSGSSSSDSEDGLDFEQPTSSQRQEETASGGAAGGITSSGITSSTHNVIENRTYIRTLNAPLHIGPSLAISNTVFQGGQQPGSIRIPTKTEQDHIMECSRSRRMVSAQELRSIAGHIGERWKHVGNALKFNHAQLDEIEDEKPDSIAERVEYMLLLWINWRCERATINRLTKALFKHNVYDAIMAITP